MHTIQLTNEQADSLEEHGIAQNGEFVVMRPAALRELMGISSDDELRRELQPALDEANAGPLAAWEVEAFLARMHQSRGTKS